MIRYSPQVIAALGEAGPKPPVVSEGIDTICQECGGDFEAKLSHARYCAPCRRLRGIRAKQGARDAQKLINRARVVNPSGKGRPQALSPQSVWEILESLEAGRETQAEIAARYGIHSSLVSKIGRGVRYEGDVQAWHERRKQAG
jgi:hypothetical protein